MTPLLHRSLAFLFTVLTSGSVLLAQSSHSESDLFGRVMSALHGRDCPLISDPAGNAGTNPVDFRNLFVANDGENVYFLVEFAGDASQNVSSVLHLDTDMDQTTGCNVFIPRLNGAEYGVFLDSPALGGAFVGNLTGCAAGSDDFPDRGGIRSVTRGHFIAALVPISTFRILTPGSTGFLVWVDAGGNFGPAGYTFR